MREVVIASAARTPIGSFGGTLKNTPAVTLGKTAVEEAIKRAGIQPEQVDELVFGCVLQAGLGQNVARQVSLAAGLPKETPAMTINKVCGSGLRSVGLAAQIIKAGDADIVIAGGTESMSLAPYAMPAARWGARMFDTKMVDVMVNDGLWDAFNQYHMGVTAENVAEQWGITREELDEFALKSQQKAEAAIKGALTWFEKAGYTVEDGKLTAAPDGGTLEIKATIPGDGTGDHPSFTVLTMARDALESIGFKLEIEDLANSSVLWDMLDAGSQEIWCAAWGSTIDPDMYQVYHSSGIVGRGGSDSNHYHIADDTLDKLIVDVETKPVQEEFDESTNHMRQLLLTKLVDLAKKA